MNFKTTLVSILMISAPVFASESEISDYQNIDENDLFSNLEQSETENFRNGRPGRRGGRRIFKLRKKARKVCRKAGVTVEQKTEIKAAFKAFKADQKPLAKAAKLARKNYRKTATNSDSTIDGIVTASEGVASARAKMIAAATTFRAVMAKSVFSAEQLKPGFRCISLRLKIAKIKQRRKNRREKPRRGPHQGNTQQGK